MATTLRLALLLAGMGWSLAGLCQTVPPPLPGPVIVPPSPQPLIIQTVVPDDVASASERGGIVELFPWDVTESSVAGTLKSPVSLPVRRLTSIPWEKIRALPQSPGLPAGTIHIWATPPAPTAQTTPQTRNDHLYETIRKSLENPPPPK